MRESFVLNGNTAKAFTYPSHALDWAREKNATGLVLSIINGINYRNGEKKNTTNCPTESWFIFDIKINLCYLLRSYFHHNHKMITGFLRHADINCRLKILCTIEIAKKKWTRVRRLHLLFKSIGGIGRLIWCALQMG